MTKTPDDYLGLYGTTLAVWEHVVDEASFRERVFRPACAMLRRRGWRIAEDPRIVSHARILRRFHRVGVKGELLLKIEQCGRRLAFEFWQDRYGITHPHGGFYEFNKRALMPYPLRLRCDLELAKLLAFLQQRTGYPVIDRRHLGETADARIAREYREGWHTDPVLGYPRFANGDYDRRSADGVLLSQGQTVWIYSERGRWLRGQAFYSLNNTWMVKVDRTTLRFLPNFQIYGRPPADVRAKSPERRIRRQRQLMVEAAKRLDYLRAHLFKTLLGPAAEERQVA